MRTTVRIDDDLLHELKCRAQTEKAPLGTVLNQALRRGLQSSPAKRPTYRENVVSMGAPQVDLTKALSIAAADEDHEVTRKLTARK